MDNPGKNTRGAMVPVAIAVVVAVIGTAAMLLEFGTRDEVAGNGIGMVTTAVVERAGATAYPTARDIGADQIHYVP
ncbi:hypothetical protein LJR220_002945 [Bradyrhizobium sp. LjRoot220]|uniref:hypothetical protein n=1 Tax=Bradyrhizobium sp. LjRoot220 TaxID=3342284 RepID=UPI003ECF8AAC